MDRQEYAQSSVPYTEYSCCLGVVILPGYYDDESPDLTMLRNRVCSY